MPQRTPPGAAKTSVWTAAVPAPGETDVWLVPCDGRASYAGMLSVEESRRARRFLADADRRRYAASHGALRLLLGRYLERAPAELEFVRQPGGKPRLRRRRGDPRLQFNLSHSGNWALVAVSGECSVGVDIEQVRPSVDRVALARRFFAPSEADWLRGLSPEDALAGFFRIWVVKEAYLKARGTGLSVPLRSVSVSFYGGGVTLRGEAGTGCWHAEEMALAPGHASAVVVEGRLRSLRIFELDGEGSAALRTDRTI